MKSRLISLFLLFVFTLSQIIFPIAALAEGTASAGSSGGAAASSGGSSGGTATGTAATSGGTATGTSTGTSTGTVTTGTTTSATTGTTTTGTTTTTTTTGTDTTAPVTTPTTTTPGTTPTTTATDTTPLNATEAEFNSVDERMKGTQNANSKVRIFGSNLFDGSFKTKDYTNVPADYVLTNGDQLQITFWGSINNVVNIKVNNDGNIIFPQIGSAHVAGLSVSEAEKKLDRLFRTQFSDFQLKIELDASTYITVYLIGQAQKTGTYSPSAVTSLADFLMSVGGPADNGTMRNIELIRKGNIVAKFDFYNFLIRGDKTKDIRLQSGDIINIPHVGPQVSISGAVKKPAIYELRGGEKISDLIALAQGITPTAYLKNGLLSRIDANKERIVLNVDISGAVDKKGDPNLNIELKDRDAIAIFEILPDIKNYITISGNIERPGRYQITQNMKVSDVVNLSNGLLPGTYMERAEIVRYVDAATNKTIPFNLDKAMKGDPEHNIKLEKWDEVRIFVSESVIANQFGIKPGMANGVSLNGNVQFPGIYNYSEGMTVKDLLMLGKGLLPATYMDRAEIIRYKDQKTNEIIPFNITSLMGGDESQNIKLERWDEVKVYNENDIIPKDFVYIGGEVKKSPSQFELTPNMRISDIIFKAGGLTDKAYAVTGELSRTIVDGETFRTERIQIDPFKAMTGDPKYNLVLQKYDSVVIRKIPDLKLGESVLLRGEVKFPGLYAIQSGETLWDVIQRAGGYTRDAFPKGAVFTRTTIKNQEKSLYGKLKDIQMTNILNQVPPDMKNSTDGDAQLYKQMVDNQRELVGLLDKKELDGRVFFHLTPGEAKNILLEDGDQILIPKIPTEVSIMGEVYNQGALLYKPGLSLTDYLNQVGGLKPTAMEAQVHVIKASGDVLKNNSWFGGTIAIEPGDTIIVPTNVEPKISTYRVTLDVIDSTFKFLSIVATLKLLGVIK